MRSSISKKAKPSLPPRDAIRARALEEGFDAVGFARAQAPTGAGANLKTFLAEGHHGDMAWMETTADRRADPKVLWPDTKSVIALGVNYAPGHDPLAILKRNGEGAISVYAQGADYHDVIKKRLKIGRAHV